MLDTAAVVDSSAAFIPILAVLSSAFLSPPLARQESLCGLLCTARCPMELSCPAGSAQEAWAASLSMSRIKEQKTSTDVRRYISFLWKDKTAGRNGM